MKVTTKVTTSEDAVDFKSAHVINSREQQQPEEGFEKSFKCDGRSYRMFKRNQTRDACWQIDLIVKGRRIQRSLETNNATAAVTRACVEFIRPARAGRWADIELNKARQDFSGIGHMVAAYRSISEGSISPDTIQACVNAFHAVVRRGLGKESMTDDAIDALSTVVLNGKLVMEFEMWMRKLAAAQGRNMESNKRTVVAYLRNSRALFKKTNMIKFARSGLKLPPDLKEFMTEQVDRPAKLNRMPPDDGLVARTFNASLALKESDHPAYVSWLLALSSLRRGEIRWMQWDWLTQRSGGWCVMVPQTVAKSKAGRLIPLDENVRLELEAWKLKRCIGLNPEEELYVIPSPRLGHGGPGARKRAEVVFRRVDDWMRSMGWTTNHTMHEMRAYVLGLVRDDYGLDTTQAVAGHSDQRTTKEHYVGQKSVKGVTISLPVPFAPQSKMDHVEMASTK